MKVPTSLLDATLCLLFVFIMLVARVGDGAASASERVLPIVEVPPAAVEADGATTRRNVSISLTWRDGAPQYLLEGRALPLGELVRSVGEKYSESPLVIRGSEGIPYATVIDLLARLQAAGAKSISLAYETPQ